MEDPQVIIEMIRVAQSHANSVLSLLAYDLQQSGSSQNQTDAWIQIFAKTYQGISRAVSAES